MILQKFFSRLTIFSLILSLSLVYFFVEPTISSAQQQNEMACMLNGLPTATVLSVKETPEVDAIIVDVEVTNQSTYRFENVSIAVALYESASAQAPAYWTVLDKTLSMSPQDTLGLGASLDVQNIPAGSYVVKVFASQGDFDNLLTVALRDSESTTGVPVNKTTPRKSDIDVNISLNGEVPGGQILTFENRETLDFAIETTNNNSRAFVGSALEVVVTEGEVPAGTAVSQRYSDSIKLIPGSTRQSIFTDPTTLGGRYTVYATIEQANVLHELIRIPLQLGDEPGDSVFRYITGVGLGVGATDDEEVSVVSCVGTIGNDIELEQYEVVSVTTSTGGEAIFDASAIGQNAVFTVTKTEASTGIDVTLNSSYAAAPPQTEGAEISLEELPLQFTPVDIVEVQFDCESDDCELRDMSWMGNQNGGEKGQGKTFYYYAGIVLAAALLAYIMIRRLHPDSSVQQETTVENPDTELQ